MLRSLLLSFCLDLVLYNAYLSVIVWASVCNARVMFDRVTVSIELFVSTKT